MYADLGYYSFPVETTMCNLEKLRMEKWLDYQTRSVTMRFLLYNGNVDLFTQVKVTFDFKLGGRIIKKVDVVSQNIRDPCKSSGTSISLSLACLLYLFVLLSCCRAVKLHPPHSLHHLIRFTPLTHFRFYFSHSIHPPLTRFTDNFKRQEDILRLILEVTFLIILAWQLKKLLKQAGYVESTQTHTHTHAHARGHYFHPLMCYLFLLQVRWLLQLCHLTR